MPKGLRTRPSVSALGTELGILGVGMGFYMKTIFSFIATVLFSANGFGQTSSSSEVMCRGQAKEAAMQTYSSCITVARNNQVDEIRKNYQKELAAVKAKYDRELKKMGAGSNKKSAKNAAPTVKEVRAAALPPKATKGLAKELPTKQVIQTEALPVQTAPTEDTKVVSVNMNDSDTNYAANNKSADIIETESAEAERVEIVEMPVE